MSYVNFNIPLYGFIFEGVAEVEEAEPADDINPGWPMMVSIISIKVNGSDADAITIIDPAVISIIETIIKETQ